MVKVMFSCLSLSVSQTHFKRMHSQNMYSACCFYYIQALFLLAFLKACFHFCLIYIREISRKGHGKRGGMGSKIVTSQFQCMYQTRSMYVYHFALAPSEFSNLFKPCSFVTFCLQRSFWHLHFFFFLFPGDCLRVDR